MDSGFDPYDGKKFYIVENDPIFEIEDEAFHEMLDWPVDEAGDLEESDDRERGGADAGTGQDIRGTGGRL